MSWLQKRPQVSNPTAFYTVGLNKTVLIVGLGNPGKEYTGTRHNIGFKCIDEFVSSQDDFGPWINKKDLKCELSIAQIADKRVIAMKPTTFMNNSGEAIQAVSHFYKANLSNILVVHDEIDINFGQIRIRLGGLPAGHNGIKSVTQQLGDDSYERVRIGIGPKKPASIDSRDFVLAKFNKKESEDLALLYKEVSAIIYEFIFSDKLPNETRNFII